MYMGKKKTSVYSMTMRKKFVVDQDATEKIIILLSNQVILTKFMRKETNGSESDINNNKDVHAERVTDPEPKINESR